MYYAVGSIEEHTFEQQDICIYSAKAMLSVERFSDFFCYFLNGRFGVVGGRGGQPG